jgi:hypothetical protein
MVEVSATCNNNVTVREWTLAKDTRSQFQIISPRFLRFNMIKNRMKIQSNSTLPSLQTKHLFTWSTVLEVTIDTSILQILDYFLILL